MKPLISILMPFDNFDSFFWVIKITKHAIRCKNTYFTYFIM